MSACEVLTWIGLGSARTWADLNGDTDASLVRWQTTNFPAMLLALEARSAAAPYCAFVRSLLPETRAPTARERAQYVDCCLSPKGPETLRQVRAGARRRSGRLLSYADLTVALRAEMERNGREDEWLRQAADELMEALRGERIIAHGVPSTANGDRKVGHPHVPVPWSVMVGRNVTVTLHDQICVESAGAMSDWMANRGNIHHDVRFKTAEVLALWPVQSPRPRKILRDLPAAWSLLECIAWIMFRDPGIVYDTAEETPRQGTVFKVEHVFPDGQRRLVDQTGEDGNSQQRLDLEWACLRAENPSAEGCDSRAAIEKLLTALRAGRLEAQGILRGGSNRQPMQAGDWRGLGLQERSRGKLSARPARTTGLFWDDVTVPMRDVLAEWPPLSTEVAAAEAVLPAAVSDRTGAPGRPTSVHLVRTEFGRRADAGQAEGVLAVEARLLSAWLNATYPLMAAMAPRTIENAIREDFNGRKAKPTK